MTTLHLRTLWHRSHRNADGSAEEEGVWAGFLAVGFLGLSWIGLNEVPHRPDHHITQGDISFVGNGLEYVLFVRGNADCHDPVASFWHGREGRCSTEGCKISFWGRTLYDLPGVG